MIALLVVLMVAILGLTFAAVGAVGDRFVRQQIAADLQGSARVFERFFADRNRQLMHSTELLSGDFAFKQAYGNGDRDTLYSAVRNLQQNRLSADLMLLLDDEDLSVVVDTRYRRAAPPEFAFPQLVSSAELQGEPVWSLELLDQQLYQLVVVPLLAPEPVAWIVVGFVVDDAFASDLRDLTRSELTFVFAAAAPNANAESVLESPASTAVSQLQRSDRALLFPASTLDAETRRDHALSALGESPRHSASFFFSSSGQPFAGLTLALADQKTTVVLQRSVELAMRPFMALYRILSTIAVVGLLALILGVAVLARQITRPVQQLAAGVRLLQQGDYSTQVNVHGRDELAQLATAFNQMTRGLAAFQRYVPTQLVRTLIDKGIESVPQSRVATMIYTDIENFTGVAEQLEPQRLVQLLNDYFSAVTEPIKQYNGVITQYQGDAILAVFNLTGDDPEHASHAVSAALAIQSILARRRFGEQQLTLATRIGVNTGCVVAGSVGSTERMNYTVHGDPVNLAARLESLNKRYGSRVLTSESTVALLQQGFKPELIDRVTVDGKRAPVTVYKLA